jgi:plastocyanin
MSRHLRRRGTGAVVAGLLALLSLAPSACGSDGDQESAGEGLSSSDGGGERSETTPASEEACDLRGADADAEATTSVEVSLTEYAVATQPATVPAGPVELVVANDGRIWHELVVVRTEADPGALPVDAYGGADEAQIPEQDIVGKVLEFLAGTTCRATFDLEPGRYALICNLVDDGSNPHYTQGMYGALTVT